MNLWGNEPVQPLFDYLIIDESSKTTFQEFLYPAVFARKWILVGDIRQLSPYTEEKELIGNVKSLACLSPEHQRALLIPFILSTYRRNIQVDEQWLIAENGLIIDHLISELIHRFELKVGNEEHNLTEQLPRRIVLVKQKCVYTDERLDGAGIIHITPEELLTNAEKGIHLLCATWVIVDGDLLPRVASRLPPSLLSLRKPSDEIFANRHARWLRVKDDDRRLRGRCWVKGKNLETCRELEGTMRKRFRKEFWAKEWVWRVKRINELKLMDETRSRARYRREVALLTPYAPDKKHKPDTINEKLDDIKSIAFPSILESLQTGIPVNRQTQRKSFLSEGIGKDSSIWKDRHRLLRYQHRMEPEIADIPKRCFYKNEALEAANTIEGRRLSWGFTFPEDSGYPIFGWNHVFGSETKGRNRPEAEQVLTFLKKIEKWAEENPPRVQGKECWDVAVLTFYLAQESLFKDLLRKWTGQNRENRFEKGRLHIVVGTIDRFQGREADIVLLSLRNVTKMGFLDSMNRMNVGLTRARVQLVIFGNRNYFSGEKHDIDEWRQVARKAKLIT